MTVHDVGTTLRPARARVSGPADRAVHELVAELDRGLGDAAAAAVLWFASAAYDPRELAGPIARAFPDAAVVGCSTAGEFTDRSAGTGGISAVALPFGLLGGAVAALGDLSVDVEAGAAQAVAALEESLQIPLRELDPTCHLGFTLIDGLHGAEEQVNEVLGNAAPLLDFVGGSAGDDLHFNRTWVAVGDHVSDQGVALMVCQAAVPFHIVKSCSFQPTGYLLEVTDADVPARTVRAFNGRLAADAYAAAVGLRADQLDDSVWMRHPLGLVLDGQPWIRSPKAVTPEGYIEFYAQIVPGTQVQLMQSTDLVTETRAALTDAWTALGGRASGGVMFNCILRRLEMDADGLTPGFLAAFDRLPVGGFHTYGESWLGHINQTLTGVVFG